MAALGSRQNGILSSELKSIHLVLLVVAEIPLSFMEMFSQSSVADVCLWVMSNEINQWKRIFLKITDVKGFVHCEAQSL